MESSLVVCVFLSVIFSVAICRAFGWFCRSVTYGTSKRGFRAALELPVEGSNSGEPCGMESASPVPPAGDSSRSSYEQDSQLPSPSGHPAEIAGVMLRSITTETDSSLQLDEVKHKIFISHSGAQKDFAEQLCVDLERRGFLCPFFDQRHHSLPKGKDFVPRIKEAARHCLAAVIVLSEDFLRSKWPMIELAEFHGAQLAGSNQRLNMLPLFYKLSVKDLDERAIEKRWMPTWRQLANGDERIDVGKWIAAVRALRKVNGLVFGQKGTSEVAYRKDIVQSIFRLSPSDLLYGSSRNMVGYGRISQMVSDQFVRGTRGGPTFLGVYGATGTGKTTLSKALCDHFCGEYMGRVCHVDLNEMSRLRRVKWMLERLCGFEKEVLDRIKDFDQGLMLIYMHLKREPVFLVIENVIDIVTNDNKWEEVNQYVMAGFHPGSRVVITSRSISNIEALVPNLELSVLSMPRLNGMEAGELFLRSAVPGKSISVLSAAQRRIVRLCIEQCLFSEETRSQGEWGFVEHGMRYHPVALAALGDFLRRYFSTGNMVRWMEYLEEKKDPLGDLWNAPNSLGRIIGLQFHSLHPQEQLLFLDVAALDMPDDQNYRRLFSDCFTFNVPGVTADTGKFLWLCKVHDKTRPDMGRQLQDLDRSGMINYSTTESNFFSFHDILMPEIYWRYAKWYATNHGIKQLKNAWCVLNTLGSTQNKYVASDLVRLRMFDIERANARLLSSKTMQELHGLEVLQLVSNCPYLTELNLEGLECLKHLELSRLPNLVAVTLTGNGDMAKNCGIFESLQFVVLLFLDSLLHGPDLRRCTSLYECRVDYCESMTNMDMLECPSLKVFVLCGLASHQLARLPIVMNLQSLEVFVFIFSNFGVTMSDVEASRGLNLRDLGKPYLKVVEEFLIYMRTNQVVDVVEDCGHLTIEWRGKGFYSNYEAEYLKLVDSSREVCYDILS